MQAFDERGELVWQTDYDIYGNLRNLKGDRNFIPFRQLGQIEDEDAGLYYNRFRWYSADTGLYLSQDPIGLAGNNPTLYEYVSDTNSWVDVLGLKPVNPKDINFSQRTINKKFDTPNGKVSFQSEVNRLKAQKKINPDFKPEYPPIKVAEYKGQLVVIDGNSRLAAARIAKLNNIEVEIVSDIDNLKDLNQRLAKNGLGNNGTNEIPKCK